MGSHWKLRTADIGAVFIGGMIGTAGRWAVGDTLLVNLTGAFVLGAALSWLARSADRGWRRRVRLLFGTGVCGAWTSYSALVIDTFDLAGRSGPALATGYVVLTVVAGLACCWLGMLIGARLPLAGAQ